MNEHTIYPYIHSFSNMRSSETLLKGFKIPDVLPSSLPSGPSFSLVAGDFEEIYGRLAEDDEREPQQGKWDAVLTCFFIDTVSESVPSADFDLDVEYTLFLLGIGRLRILSIISLSYTNFSLQVEFGSIAVCHQLSPLFRAIPLTINDEIVQDHCSGTLRTQAIHLTSQLSSRWRKFKP